MKGHICKLLRGIAAAAAAVCILWSCLWFSVGSVIGIVLFGAVLICALFGRPLWRLVMRLWKRLAGRIALIALCAVVCFGLFAAVFFSVNMARCMYKPLDRVDVVIVLGCRVRGETPSSLLRSRCYTAAQVLKEHPGAVCIVAGGQGEGEDISEAEAMRRLMAEYGIEDERVFKEDKSTSTAENFAFSLEIMQREGLSGNVAIVTSDYHQYRASLYAKRAGIEAAGHYSGSTSIFYFMNSWLREWAALAATFVFGY